MVDLRAAAGIYPDVMITRLVPFGDLPAAFEALKTTSGQYKVIFDPQKTYNASEK